MYYEEKIIKGVYMWRGTPKGEWKPMTNESLTAKIIKLEESNKNLSELLRITNDYSTK